MRCARTWASRLGSVAVSAGAPWGASANAAEAGTPRIIAPTVARSHARAAQDHPASHSNLLVGLSRPGACGVSCRARDRANCPRADQSLRPPSGPQGQAADSPRPGGTLTPGIGFPVRPRTGRRRFGRSNRPARMTAIAPKKCEMNHAGIVKTAYCKNSGVPNHDRLSGLDSSFLHLERDSAHMHVAACAVFKGTPPAHDELAGGDRVAAAPGPALPAAAGLRPARPGPARVGGRPPLQRRLPRPAHRSDRTPAARTS